MTEDQAYKAMFVYLDEYFHRCPDAELGQVLGDLQLASDGLPFDPAVTADWQRAIAQVLRPK